MKIHRFSIAMIAVSMFFLPVIAVASDGASGTIPDLTMGMLGMLAVVIFVAAYALVISEEFSHLRKSKPVIVAAGIIWVLVAIAYHQHGDVLAAEHALRANFLEYAELLLFLLSAMTFINTMDERNIFKAMRAWMVSAGFTLRTIFWLTGLMAFFISPLADNLTTALLMVSIVLAVSTDRRFIAVSCINIVVAANAGGAFSPFGDITTLMVWQKGVVKFEEFLALIVPSLVNWLIPAAFMAATVPKQRPHAIQEEMHVKYGGYVVVGLFLLTITMTVSMHHFLHLPPFLGMMTGLGLLKVYGYFIRRDELCHPSAISGPNDEAFAVKEGYKPAHKPFDIFISMKRAEWDTLMFFYGVVLCVGGLGAFGYLAATSQFLYQGFGATSANVYIGIASAIIDNIPIMYAVLIMNPDMALGQWLLVTLTAGVGGSLLSIGSAAGVALMGQARGIYTFFSHLKWTWAIALGYAASIWVHMTLNARLF
jgi:Na+/H+ antiporter NhaD/arsenite permease-like protein